MEGQSLCPSPLLGFLPYEPDTGAKREGWATAGLSSQTAIVIGTKFILFPTKLVKEAANNPSYRTTSHIADWRVQENKEQGRTYTDAENKLIPVSELAGHDEAMIFDMPDWYVSFWRRKHMDKKGLNEKFWNDYSKE